MIELTCIECPMGCTIEVEFADGKVTSVKGNNCARGKLYAESEATCPRRVVTSTVKTADGRVVPVKTDAPIQKAKIFEVMKIINGLHPSGDIRIGDILMRNVDGANIVATDNSFTADNK